MASDNQSMQKDKTFAGYRLIKIFSYEPFLYNKKFLALKLLTTDAAADLFQLAAPTLIQYS